MVPSGLSEFLEYHIVVGLHVAFSVSRGTHSEFSNEFALRDNGNGMFLGEDLIRVVLPVASATKIKLKPLGQKAHSAVTRNASDCIRHQLPIVYLRQKEALQYRVLTRQR